MNYTPEQFIELNRRILLLLDGEIDDADFAQLEGDLRENAEAFEYYQQFIELYASLRNPASTMRELSQGHSVATGAVLSDTDILRMSEEDPAGAGAIDELDIPSSDTALWTIIEHDLAAQTHPVLPANNDAGESLPHVQSIHPRLTRKTLFSVLMKAAVFVLVSLGVIYVDNLIKQEKARPVVVATVAESFNAKWADPTNRYEKGTWLYTGEKPLILLEGMVKVTFDQGSEVILAAPAEFNIINEDLMRLHQGRLYAKVPVQGHGFTVEAPGCRIVDVGTEFGVIALANGLCEAHVLEGRVELTDQGKNGQSPATHKLSTGQMGSFSRNRNIQVHADAARPMAFVREMPNENSAAIPGRVLDLADVVGGGNGFGTGLSGYSLNLVTGTWQKENASVNRMGSRKYVSVAELPYVDGVFVPDGGGDPVQISSQGHIFLECPDTNNIFYSDIVTFGVGGRSIFQGRQYGTPQHPCLFMHANAGITFDLDAIRAAMPGVDITQFTALLGISDKAPRDEFAHADGWVLVDGRVRFTHFGLRIREGVPIEIDIAPEDRFLTLAITDGGDPNERISLDGRKCLSTDSDWCMFMDPFLKMKGK